MRRKLITYLLIFFLIVTVIPLLTDSAEGAWWDNDWQEYINIYIKQENILSDIYDYPVLLVINSTLGAKCDNGNSIRFLDPDNSTEYSYEIERWNNTGDSFVWVKIPHVSASSNTNFLMYYNNSVASDNQYVEDVWSNNFTAVWHLENNSYPVIDSTSNHYNLTPGGGAVYVENSKIAGGWYFDGINDCLSVANFDPNDVGTITLQTRRGCSSCGRDRIIGGVDEFEVVVRGDNLLTNHLFVKGSGILAGTAWTNTVSYDGFAFTWNYTSNLNEIYIKSEIDAVGYLADDEPGVFTITLAHSNWYSGEFYNGYLDEVRISSIDRDQSWVRAVYENTDNASNFTVWESPFSQATVPPIQYNEIPTDGGTAGIIPTLFITVDDLFDRTLNATWYSNSSGTWQQFGSNLSIDTTSGAVILDMLGVNFSVYNTTYYWSLNLTNGYTWNNKTYSFTTTLGEEPYVFDFTPPDNDTGVYLPVALGVRVVDINGHKMNITFYTNASGSWQQIGLTIVNVYDGTYWVYGSPFTLYNYTYYWKVKVTDEIGLTNTTVYARTFKFTTTDHPETRFMMFYVDSTEKLVSYMGLFGIFGLLGFLCICRKKKYI